MTTEIVRGMAFCGSTNDAVVVGIGYATETKFGEAWDERLDLRYQDLTPVRDEDVDKSKQERTGREVKSGGAGNFLQFLNSEIINIVESSYRVDENERTLVGHSLGGLFTLFAMFQKPDQFKNYIASSPGMISGKQSMLDIEKAFSSEHSALPARLVLSMGELEKDWDNNFDGMLRLYNQLDSRGYEQFEVVKKIYPDEDHCTVSALSLTAGLKFALRFE